MDFVNILKSLSPEQAEAVKALNQSHIDARLAAVAELASLRNARDARLAELQELMAAAGKQASETLRQKQAELDEVHAHLGRVMDRAGVALADGKVTEEERAGMLSALLAEAAKPAIARKIEATEAGIAAQEAELSRLRGLVAPLQA